MRGGRAHLLDQMLMDLFGSQSSRTTPAPAWANSVARMTAAVDLPAPPLGEATVRTGISVYPIFYITGYKKKPDKMQYQIITGYAEIPYILSYPICKNIR